MSNEFRPLRAGTTASVRLFPDPTEMAMTKATSPAPVLGCRAELAQLPTTNCLSVSARADGTAKSARSRARSWWSGTSGWSAPACRQYRGSPEPVEDLMQVGYVGLLKAINNYDPAFGSGLSAYAAPCISGEIKRHFRDKRWQVHVRRSAQELLLELRKATEELTQEPRPGAHRRGARRAARLQPRGPARGQAGGHGVQRLLARRAAVRPATTRRTLGDVLGDEDADVEHAIDMEAVSTHWDELPRARAAHPGHALLRQPHPGRDRRPARHLPDARVPAAGPGARPPAQPPARQPRRASCRSA